MITELTTILIGLHGETTRFSVDQYTCQADTHDASYSGSAYWRRDITSI